MRTRTLNMKQTLGGMAMILACIFVFLAFMATKASAATNPGDCVAMQMYTKSGDMPFEGTDTLYIKVIDYCDDLLAGYVSLPADTSEIWMFGRSNHHLDAPQMGAFGEFRFPRIWNIQVNPLQTTTLVYPVKTRWAGASKSFAVWWYNDNNPYQGIRLERKWALGKG